MDKMHSLLKRQMKRYLGSMSSIPKEWEMFLDAVNEAYWQMDMDREMLERSLELSSQELLQSNSEISAVYRAFPDLFFRADENGMILDYKASGEPGVSSFEKNVIGLKITDVFPEDIGNKFSDAITRVQELHSLISIEYSISCQGGELYYEARLLPLLNSQIIIIVRDISDRKRNEEALRESQQRLHDIFDFLPDATFAIDLERKVIAWNRAIEDMTGVKAENMLGKGDYEYSLPFYGVRRPILIDLVFKFNEEIEKKYRFVRSERDVLITEADVPLRGEHHVLWGKARPLYDVKGNIVGAIESIRDITENKKLEAQFFQAQKMEAIGTLAGGIAHDFNNLLMGIVGHTSLMLFNMDASHPHYEKLRAIEDQVKSGAELTRQLLGFARRGKYEVQPTNLNVILENTSSMFGRTRKEITIHRKFQQNLATVEVDRGQIEQMLLNLYVNAWQAMPGGGEIILETMNVTIDEKFAKHYAVNPGNYVKILVTDRGMGMDKKTQQRIFEPFFTTKEMGRGTGLGLASAYGIIRSHGGFINVYSEKGRGTTFGVYLPASKKEIQAEQGSLREIFKGHETILLVDDEDVIVRVGKEILEALGYTVIVARNGEEAVEIYRRKNKEIDLVILDMIMPGMGGAETFDVLRTINSEAKVVLSSGYSVDGRPAKMLEKGCRSFIQKPYSMADLSHTIREALDL